MKWFYRGTYTLHGTVNFDCFLKITQNCVCEELSEISTPSTLPLGGLAGETVKTAILSAYHHHHSVNHGIMICVLLMVVFFTVCTTIDWA